MSSLIKSRIDGHGRELLRGASVAFILKIIGAGLTFLLNVLVARMLGPADAGLYFLGLTLVTIAAVIARAGLDNAVVRFIATHAAAGDWAAVKGVYRIAINIAFVSSILSASVLALGAPWLAERVFEKPDLAEPLRWMCFSVPVVVLFTLHSQALQGLKRITAAISVLTVWAPLATVLGLLLLVPRWGVNGAAWAYTAGAALAFFIGLRSWYSAAPRGATSGNLDKRAFFRSSRALFWVATMNLVLTWSSTLILGAWASSEDVAIFSAANRTAMLTSFVLTAVNSIAAPKFAALYAQNDMGSLSRTAHNSAKLMTLVASPILIILLVFPENIMSIFGGRFVHGADALSILAIGQFVNVATGSVGYLLMMTGHERIMRNNLILCAIVSVLVGMISVPTLGVKGAAIASALTLVLHNLIAAWMVSKKLNVVTIPFIPARRVR